MKTKYRSQDKYPHGFNQTSKEYKRMWYLCKKHNISYKQALKEAKKTYKKN